jgi:hypothetical protein
VTHVPEVAALWVVWCDAGLDASAQIEHEQAAAADPPRPTHTAAEKNRPGIEASACLTKGAGRRRAQLVTLRTAAITLHRL